MNEKLIKIATEVAKLMPLNGHKENRARSCGAALLTKSGNIYTGVSIHLTCGLGFCAEASAIAEMLKAGESEIKTIVAVHYQQGIITPCGRCREMMCQVNTANIDTEIIIAKNQTATLRELLPFYCWSPAECPIEK